MKALRFLFTHRRLSGLAAVVLLAFGVRVCAAIAAHASTFDTATVGLMGLRILDGERPLFFEGQSYMGSLEAYLAAALFAIFKPGELTLSLSPILFSLGWIAATFFLLEELIGTASAFAGALTIAVPTWVTLWYCIGAYGGYPGSFFFGTVSLWLALRVLRRELSLRALWFHFMLMGLAAGLAIWTDFLAAVYVAAAGLIVCAWLVRRRLESAVAGPILAGAACGLAGISPVLLRWRGVLDEDGVGWCFAPSVVFSHLRGLFSRPLRDNLMWHNRTHVWFMAVIMALLCVGIALYAADIISADWSRKRRLLLLPAFCVLFLAFYLPHPLAAALAPRHVIPLWTTAVVIMFACAVSAEVAWIRRAGWGLLVAWLAAAGTQDVVAAMEARPKKLASMDTRRIVVQTAQELGLKNVEMVGGHIFGHEGQVYSFAALGRINFVSTFDERHQPSAQEAEGDRAVAFLCRNRTFPLLQRTLEDLGADCRIEDAGPMRIAHSISLTWPRRRSIPCAEMSASVTGAAFGDPAFLFDRIAGSVVTGRFGEGEGVIVELKSVRPIGGLYLVGWDMSEKGLPEDARVEICSEDGQWQCVRRSGRRVPNAHVSGNRVYIDGYNPAMEIRFRPTRASKVRLTFIAGGAKQETWTLDEICVFEDAGCDSGPVGEDEVADIAKEFARRRCSFAVCDRWLSARLLALLPASVPDGRPPVFPRFNPKHSETMLPRRFVPETGMAFVLPLDVASDAEAVLRKSCRDSLKLERKDYSHYAFIAVGGADPSAPQSPVRWDGVLLRQAGHDEGG